VTPGCCRGLKHFPADGRAGVTAHGAVSPAAGRRRTRSGAYRNLAHNRGRGDGRSHAGARTDRRPAGQPERPHMGCCATRSGSVAWCSRRSVQHGRDQQQYGVAEGCCGRSGRGDVAWDHHRGGARGVDRLGQSVGSGARPRGAVDASMSDWPPPRAQSALLAAFGRKSVRWPEGDEAVAARGARAADARRAVQMFSVTAIPRPRWTPSPTRADLQADALPVLRLKVECSEACLDRELNASVETVRPRSTSR
jgi:hypothetical protein